MNTHCYEHDSECYDENCTCDCEDCAGASSEEEIAESVVLKTDQFDKFMDNILIKEARSKTVEHEETPQRKYNKLYREKPLNRVVIGGKK